MSSIFLLFLHGLPNPQRVFIWMSKQKTNKLKRKKSMLVYPAHHVLNTDSPSRLLLLLFSYGAASRCDLFGDRSWISERLIVFSGGRKDLYFILMQDQVSAGAFPPPPNLLRFLSQTNPWPELRGIITPRSCSITFEEKVIKGLAWMFDLTCVVLTAEGMSGPWMKI